MVVKELVDNAIDATELAGTSPEIKIVIAEDSIAVTDNGPGIPFSTLETALDYDVRISTNAKYISPTRGQQGNALKTLFAVPYVVDGEQGKVEVSTQDYSHEITVRTDAIRQEPVIEITNGKPGLVRNGTFSNSTGPRNQA